MIYLVSRKMRVGLQYLYILFSRILWLWAKLESWVLLVCLLQNGYPAKVRDKRTNRPLEYHCELWVLSCSHGLHFPVVFQPQCHRLGQLRKSQGCTKPNPCDKEHIHHHLQVYSPSTLLLRLPICLSAIKIACWIRLSDRNLTDSEIKTLNDLKLNPTQALGLKDIASMSRVTHSGFLFRYESSLCLYTPFIYLYLYTYIYGYEIMLLHRRL